MCCSKGNRTALTRTLIIFSEGFLQLIDRDSLSNHGGHAQVLSTYYKCKNVQSKNKYHYTISKNECETPL